MNSSHQGVALEYNIRRSRHALVTVSWPWDMAVIETGLPQPPHGRTGKWQARKQVCPGLKTIA